MTTLTTKRLVLRPITEDDAEAMHPALSDPETLRYWHQLPTTSLEQTRAFLLSTGANYFTITLDGEVVGFVGFGAPQDNRQTAFGYLLRKEYWNQGIVTEAAGAVIEYGFKKLDIMAAELWIYDGNVGSIRVAEKLGGIHRGTNVGFNLLRGLYTIHVYEIPNKPMPPEVLRVIPLLQVDDVGAAIDWYRATLDFGVEWALDDPPTQASMTSPGWLPLAAILRFHLGPNQPARLAFPMRDRLDEYAASIVARGVTLASEPTTYPWGMRRFEVVDPFGNTLTFETVDV